MIEPIPTVLVVDDSPTVRKIVQMTLQREHIRVITAGDGLSALTSVADEMPALILLDIQLPRMDGYHICQIIRKNLQFRSIPIIMLSGKDGLFDKMRGRLAGSTEYLTKPFDSAELIQTVKKHLVGWQQRVPPRHEGMGMRTRLRRRG
ncbi:MAG TPA: response regulator [Ktedonobacteraceae bacterium]|jgi:twitching motility two-component system response regulator PilG|nr:response regulator [Ktedonobacteraceae bacterium]